MHFFRRRRRHRSTASFGAHQRRLRIEVLEPRQLLAAFDVLVFSKTVGFRHDSIEEGVAAIEALGAANDFTVVHTEDASVFTQPGLAQYEAIVFLSTTGNVLDAAQEVAFQEYIRGGGGYVGVHASADSEYDWAWYGQLLGAYFANHPVIQSASVLVADHSHASTAQLPDRWVRTDEWYNFNINPRGNVHVLVTLDESTYTGGTQGYDHPISWYHYFEGGRSWYTGMGHTVASYSEQPYLQHLLGGIQFAAGQAPADQGATINSNWNKVVLEEDITSPMSLDVAPNGDVYFLEREGNLKVYHPSIGSTSIAATLPVHSVGEDGLLGIALDPSFEQNHWIYLFYSPAGTTPEQFVSRFTLVGDVLDFDSEKVVLQIPTDRVGFHSAGSLAFGPDGLLYISVGDDTDPRESSGYAPLDEQPQRSEFDAQRSAGNTHDLRGAILRIKPEVDGTYSIPEGNLFPSDGSQGRPEIYIMGTRNPFRITVDSETGWLYWGDFGPDATFDDVNRGPRGYDEVNQARASGNYGWPYFLANNQAYIDYNFATQVSGSAFNPAAPINDSPNNTGSTSLPPAKPALIWYPSSPSAEFPSLESGQRTIMVGPVYHFDTDLASDVKLPEYFDDTLFIFDSSRSTVWEVKLDSNGDLLQINKVFSTLSFLRPIEMEIGPDGALYVLEWGSTANIDNPDAKLVRVDFTGNLPHLIGDYNGDLVVDAADYVTWRMHADVEGVSPADGDHDGYVNRADYNLWRVNFGNTAPAQMQASAITVESEGLIGEVGALSTTALSGSSPAVRPAIEAPAEPTASPSALRTAFARFADARRVGRMSERVAASKHLPLQHLTSDESLLFVLANELSPDRRTFEAATDRALQNLYRTLDSSDDSAGKPEPWARLRVAEPVALFAGGPWQLNRRPNS